MAIDRIVVRTNAFNDTRKSCRLYMLGFVVGLIPAVNGNFQQLVTWVQQKVGTVGSANVTITGSETVSGKLTANSGLDVVGNTNLTGTTAVVGNQSVSGTSNLTVLNVSAVANVNGLTAPCASGGGTTSTAA